MQCIDVLLFVSLVIFEQPVMDGPTATAKIRSEGYHGFIFGVTGNATEHQIKEFSECGADKVFIKPVDVNNFKAELMTCCLDPHEKNL